VETLEDRVRARIRGSGARSVAVVARPVAGDGPHLRVDADRVFHAASTMKVPVLIELERRAAAGDLTLDDALVVRNAFRSLADGSPYVLDPADDSEHALYGRVGEAVPLRDLAFLAITESSNLATNLLVDRLGAERISATMAALGAPSLVVRRGVEDDAAWEAGLNNTVTAAGLATVLLALSRRELVSSGASDEMLAILRAQAFNEGIPAGLPASAVVAHKTGSITDLYHDAAIVEAADAPAYVLVVLTEGLEETRAAPALVASMAGIVHEAFVTPPR
jgi:beta-lactamase class A